VQVALQTNAELLQLPDKYEASDSAAILAQVSADLNSPAESTRLEALHWVSPLFCNFLQQFCTLFGICNLLYLQSSAFQKPLPSPFHVVWAAADCWPRICN